MNFLVREVHSEDLSDLYDLSRQFSLLNLPSQKKVIQSLIEKSRSSFAGELEPSEALYLFVLEDLENGSVVGASQVKGKKGTPSIPNYSFKISKRELFSRDLGVGFIHQVLKLRMDEDGPTEIAGLIVSRGYRQRPEKVGKIMSLTRFLYIAQFREKFQNQLLAEMAPPLTDEGRSEFWEALGRRFTGMPYQEADALSHQSKEFIRDLFPQEDIYLCLLDASARLVIGRVSEQTRPALHLLEKIGFQYKDEIDPFDGGPHVVAKTDEVTFIKQASEIQMQKGEGVPFDHQFLVGVNTEEGYRAGQTAGCLINGQLWVPEKTLEALSLASGDSVYHVGL
jgi:arginine N-succinyltransferase